MRQYLNVIVSLPFVVGACAAEPATDEQEEALSQYACPDGVPSELAPAADQHLAFILRGEGVQRYMCNGTAWTFVEPVADLFHRWGDHVVGTHYAGPTWQYRDGSTVAATRTAGATVDPTAIPWLLLTASGHTEYGRMTAVSSIQRLNTVGGLAPTTGCDADHVGNTIDVPYSADYFFYRTRAHHTHWNTRCGAE